LFCARLKAFDFGYSPSRFRRIGPRRLDQRWVDIDPDNLSGWPARSAANHPTLAAPDVDEDVIRGQTYSREDREYDAVRNRHIRDVNDILGNALRTCRPDPEA